MSRKMTLPVALCLAFFCATTTKAQNKDHSNCYTLASLQGHYAIIGHYGAALAVALTEAQFDGKGNFKSTFIVNEPDTTSTTEARKLVSGSQTGTYTINCDGSGVITRFVTLSNGTTGTVVSDFIITKAVRSPSDHGSLLAEAVEDAQQTPSFIVPGGVFLTRTYTRLPDRQDDED